MKVKKYTVLGNCQSTVIVEYLHSSIEFSLEYQYVFCPPVHTINKDKDLQLLNIFREIDLLIYQPVLDIDRFGPFISDEIKKIMKKDSISICIPSIYYDGYFPTLASIENIPGSLRGVHDFVIVASYLSGYSKEYTLSLLSDNFILNKEFIIEFHNNAVNSLRLREKNFDVDIKISNFIEEKFNSIRLFHTFNHPTMEMFVYLCNNILKILNFNEKCNIKNDLLDSVIAPIYDNIYQSLNLKFEKVPIIYNKKEYSLSEIIDNDFNIYKKSNHSYLKNILKKKKKYLLDYFPRIS